MREKAGRRLGDAEPLRDEREGFATRDIVQSNKQREKRTHKQRSARGGISGRDHKRRKGTHQPKKSRKGRDRDWNKFNTVKWKGQKRVLSLRAFMKSKGVGEVRTAARERSHWESRSGHAKGYFVLNPPSAAGNGTRTLKDTGPMWKDGENGWGVPNKS